MKHIIQRLTVNCYTHASNGYKISEPIWYYWEYWGFVLNDRSFVRKLWSFNRCSVHILGFRFVKRTWYNNPDNDIPDFLRKNLNQ